MTIPATLIQIHPCTECSSPKSHTLICQCTLWTLPFLSVGMYDMLNSPDVQYQNVLSAFMLHDLLYWSAMLWMGRWLLFSIRTAVTRQPRPTKTRQKYCHRYILLPRQIAVRECFRTRLSDFNWATIAFITLYSSNVVLILEEKYWTFFFFWRGSIGQVISLYASLIWCDILFLPWFSVFLVTAWIRIRKH